MRDGKELTSFRSRNQWLHVQAPRGLAPTLALPLGSSGVLCWGMVAARARV